MFVNVKIESDCCQKFGICGEQFVTDISFNKNGEVDATRFRFQHKPLQYQEDYIRALVETRRVCDKYGKQLQTKTFAVESPVEFELNQEAPNETKSFVSRIASAVGLDVFGKLYNNFSAKILGETAAEKLGEKANKVFTYSLFYVFYDQYTYIRGVLA